MFKIQLPSFILTITEKSTDFKVESFDMNTGKTNVSYRSSGFSGNVQGFNYILGSITGQYEKVTSQYSKREEIRNKGRQYNIQSPHKPMFTNNSMVFYIPGTTTTSISGSVNNSRVVSRRS